MTTMSSMTASGLATQTRTLPESDPSKRIRDRCDSISLISWRNLSALYAMRYLGQTGTGAGAIFIGKGKFWGLISGALGTWAPITSKVAEYEVLP